MDFKFVINNFEILQEFGTSTIAETYITPESFLAEHSLIQYESKIFQEHETVSVLAFCQ